MLVSKGDLLEKGNLEFTQPKKEDKVKVKYNNLSSDFADYWFKKADERIFSLAAGDRVALIAPKIMRLGFSKLLYAANEFGVDIDGTKSFVIFAPDGTVTFNPLRISRGFTYGCLIKSDFDGLITASNSMPNGCGFSMFEITDMSDDQLLKIIQQRQSELGENHLEQLSKGNHFAGLYYVKDPITGEDTGRRFTVVHCSGHVGSQLLYTPDTWLSDTEGFNQVETPHGPIVLLEGAAKKEYIKRYDSGDCANTQGRTDVMDEVF
ncbi:MAG: hypothetical protein ACXAC7_17025, partial [Candidatus Hodarchaeales archaeon]